MTKKKPTSWAELVEQLDYERHKRRLKAALRRKPRQAKVKEQKDD